MEAKMQRANLWNAKVQGAFLRQTHLQEAFLKGANLQGAVLREAKLERAVLTESENLELEQIKLARGDSTTLLPENLQDFKEEILTHWKQFG